MRLISISGNQVTGAGKLYAAAGETLANGSTIATLTISTGTVVEDTSLNLTADIPGLSIAVSSAFDTSYDRGANLATIQATYATAELNGDMAAFDIDAAGVISGQTATGCILSGQVSVIDATTNVYDVNLITDPATCVGLSGNYDGLGSSQDDLVMDDTFIFAVFVNGQLMIVGQAIK